MRDKELGSLISFRQLQEGDIAQLLAWRHNEHVARWFGMNATLEEMQQRYRAYITGELPTHAYIVEYDKKPIGYIQCYRVDDWPELQEAIGVYDNACGIDMFIGDETYIGRGIGTSMIAKFLRDIAFCITKTEACFLGPHPENKHAIRAYEKVGFVHVKMVEYKGELEYVMRVGRDVL